MNSAPGCHIVPQVCVIALGRLQAKTTQCTARASAGTASTYAADQVRSWPAVVACTAGDPRVALCSQGAAEAVLLIVQMLLQDAFHTPGSLQVIASQRNIGVKVDLTYSYVIETALQPANNTRQTLCKLDLTGELTSGMNAGRRSMHRMAQRLKVHSSSCNAYG